jgi:predicted DNA-binding protein YlxM (UPF0122 family)
MKLNEKQNANNNTVLLYPSSSDLRGRQSVRATFKLSAQAIEAISIVAVHLGIKQKTLFDHLIDDDRSLSLIAENINSDQFSELDRIQKTFVISRKTLLSLEKMSKRANAPRDALVEYSIRRLMPIITGESKKHRLREEVLQEIRSHYETGLEILENSQKRLGEEDPVTAKFQTAMNASLSTLRSIEQFIEKGKIIENFKSRRKTNEQNHRN